MNPAPSADIRHDVRTRIRDSWLAIVCAGLGVWTMVYLGLYGFAWTDYDYEVTPAYDALAGGHLWRFFQLAPSYGGSLELRAPFALLPSLWGGGEQARFEAVSIPCLIAAALLAVWLFEQIRKAGGGRFAQWTALVLCAANPITMYACQVGHAEEVLGGVLCVAAVLAAQRGRNGWAAVFLALAVVNKEWALVAVGPVLLALPDGRRRTLLTATAIAAAFYLPLAIAQHLASGGGAVATLGSTGSTFLPWQWWWFTGSAGHTISFFAAGVISHTGVRTPPPWLGSVSHALIVLIGVPLTLLAARIRRPVDPLLLLALLLLLRCALDPWDNIYYPLPLILALASWESLRLARPPLYAMAATFATWFCFYELPLHAGADTQALVFTLVSVPAVIALALAVYSPRAITPRRLPPWLFPHPPVRPRVSD
jgi:hypothetical protein